jgi:hypothetical protein
LPVRRNTEVFYGPLCGVFETEGRIAKWECGSGEPSFPPWSARTSHQNVGFGTLHNFYWGQGGTRKRLLSHSSPCFWEEQAAPGIVRDLLDLDSWITGSGLGLGALLREANSILWRLFAGDSGGKGEAHCAGRSHYLPCSVSSPRRRVFHSLDVSISVPCVILPLDAGQEREIILALVFDLNNKQQL